MNFKKIKRHFIGFKKINGGDRKYKRWVWTKNIGTNKNSMKKILKV